MDDMSLGNVSLQTTECLEKIAAKDAAHVMLSTPIDCVNATDTEASDS